MSVEKVEAPEIQGGILVWDGNLPIPHREWEQKAFELNASDGAFGLSHLCLGCRAPLSVHVSWVCMVSSCLQTMSKGLTCEDFT